MIQLTRSCDGAEEGLGRIPKVHSWRRSSFSQCGQPPERSWACTARVGLVVFCSIVFLSQSQLFLRSRVLDHAALGAGTEPASSSNSGMLLPLVQRFRGGRIPTAQMVEYDSTERESRYVPIPSVAAGSSRYYNQLEEQSRRENFTRSFQRQTPSPLSDEKKHYSQRQTTLPVRHYQQLPQQYRPGQQASLPGGSKQSPTPPLPGGNVRGARGSSPSIQHQMQQQQQQQQRHPRESSTKAHVTYTHHTKTTTTTKLPSASGGSPPHASGWRNPSVSPPPPHQSMRTITSAQQQQQKHPYSGEESMSSPQAARPAYEGQRQQEQQWQYQQQQPPFRRTTAHSPIQKSPGSSPPPSYPQQYQSPQQHHNRQYAHSSQSPSPQLPLPSRPLPVHSPSQYASPGTYSPPLQSPRIPPGGRASPSPPAHVYQPQSPQRQQPQQRQTKTQYRQSAPGSPSPPPRVGSMPMTPRPDDVGTPLSSYSRPRSSTRNPPRYSAAHQPSSPPSSGSSSNQQLQKHHGEWEEWAVNLAGSSFHMVATEATKALTWFFNHCASLFQSSAAYDLFEDMQRSWLSANADGEGEGGGGRQGRGEEDESTRKLPLPLGGESGESVAALIARHRDVIDQLKKACHDVLSSPTDDEGTGGAGRSKAAQSPQPRQPPHHVLDDLFFLRYILDDAAQGGRGGRSEHSLKSMEDKIRKCIRWRRRNREMLEAINRDGLGAHPIHRTFQALTGITSWRLSDGGWLDFIGTAFANPDAQKELSKRVPPEQLAEYLLMRKEFRYAHCDRATRRSGRIVKSLTFRDLSSMGTFSALAYPVAEVLGQDGGTSKAQRLAQVKSEYLHPLNTERIVFIDPPSAVAALFKAISGSCYARTTSQFLVCDRARARSMLLGRLRGQDLDLLFPPQPASTTPPSSGGGPGRGHGRGGGGGGSTGCWRR